MNAELSHKDVAETALEPDTEVRVPLNSAKFTRITEALCFYTRWHKIEAERAIHPPQLREMYRARSDSARELLNELQQKFVHAARRRVA